MADDDEVEQSLVSQLTGTEKAEKAESGDWVEEQRHAMARLSIACVKIGTWCHSRDMFLRGNKDKCALLDNLSRDSRLRLYASLKRLATEARRASDVYLEKLPKVVRSPFAQNLKAFLERAHPIIIIPLALCSAGTAGNFTDFDLLSWEFGYTEPTLAQLKELAKGLGVTTDDLLKSPEPTLDQLKQLAKALGVTTDDLLLKDPVEEPAEKPVEVPVKKKSGRPKKPKN